VFACACPQAILSDTNADNGKGNKAKQGRKERNAHATGQLPTSDLEASGTLVLVRFHLSGECSLHVPYPHPTVIVQTARTEFSGI